jgi:membrane protease YdiL (CAAX protease family)
MNLRFESNVGAIIISAIIFGLGHCLSLSLSVPNANVALILYVISGNFIFGSMCRLALLEEGA